MRKQQYLRLALATATTVGLTGGLLTCSTVTATAADSVHHPKADFNRDGYGDVAFAAGNATVGGKKNAGQIVALYGSKSGLSATRRTTISQNTTGIPDSAETGDNFGWVSAFGPIRRAPEVTIRLPSERRQVREPLYVFSRFGGAAPN